MQRKWRRTWERDDLSTSNMGTIATKMAKKLLTPIAAASILLSCMSGVYANPTGGVVTTGTGVITSSGTTTTITQATDKLSIDWTSFSIGANESVVFIQPSTTSIALNRVVGSDASTIYGTLTSNGKVFLINPNGVLFGSGAQVSVGGLVASTLNLSDADFLSGNYVFSGTGGSVVNAGTITAADGGYVVLLGAQASNQGVITAKLGTVGIGAGSQVTLDFNGDGLLSLTVDKSVLAALAENKKLIQADGGIVIMSAKSADALPGTVVQNSGIIRAESVVNSNGAIYLEGNSGTAVNSGTLDAAGPTTGLTGGTVKVLGDTVVLADGSTVNVSGAAGGGTALIGGNSQGKGTEQNATTTNVAATAVIDADATDNGNGGKAVVWADGQTNFYGTITAKGGTNGGDGGNAEVSGKTKLVYDGTTDLTASLGTTGTLLLDPTDFTITDDAYGDITTTQLAKDLTTANITILSSNGDAGTTGNIIVSSPITWASGNTLTLSAYDNVKIKASITNTGSGNLILRADNTGVDNGGTVTLTGSTAIITLNGGTIYAYGDTAPAISAGVASGTTLDSYLLINSAADLSEITSTGNYYLSQNIDATGITYTPVLSFAGLFDGDGHTISNLTISSTGASVGLFGSTASGGSIKNLGLINETITGSEYVGGLVGVLNTGSSISNCYTTGTVNGTSTSEADTGGLVGALKGGSISNSYSSTNVTGGAGYGIGGLVGCLFSGSISNSYFTGTVTSTGSNGCVGGLVGWNQQGTGTISNSYSTGSVTDTSSTQTGGLIGRIKSGGGLTVTNCYSTGVVKNGGGLVGALQTTSTFTNCYWSSTLSGQTNAIYTNTGSTVSISDLKTTAITGFPSSIWTTAAIPTLLNAGTYTVTGLTSTAVTSSGGSLLTAPAPAPTLATSSLAYNENNGIISAQQQPDTGTEIGDNDQTAKNVAGVAEQGSTNLENPSDDVIYVVKGGVNTGFDNKTPSSTQSSDKAQKK